jgi:tRNA A37 threonylcarbamoyladenosine modification protein TsaB
MTCNNETLMTPAELAGDAEGKLILTTEQKLCDLLAGSNVAIVPAPRADSIARLAYEKLRAGESVTPEALDAAYIRRSDAEIKLGK